MPPTTDPGNDRGLRKAATIMVLGMMFCEAEERRRLSTAWLHAGAPECDLLEHLIDDRVNKVAVEPSAF